MSEATAQPRELTDADKAEVRGTYEALQAGIPGFRRRGAQMHMIAAASRAFARDQGVAVVEAGTGTGKSLAYMTAGIPIARNHKLKLVISTGTVALQEQLVDRDIPLFLKTTKHPVKVRLAKGRQRYVCTRNLAEMAGGDAGGGDTLFGDADSGAWPRPPAEGEVQLLSDLLEQIHTGAWSGDLDATPRPIAEDLRSSITTSAGACENSRCVFYHQCPFIKARSSLDDADVIVANHSLLLSDLKLVDDAGEAGGVLLPKPSETLYVIDEGHHLAPVARDATAAMAPVASFQKRLPRIRNLIRAAFQATGRDRIASFDLADGLQLTATFDEEMTQLSRRVLQEWAPDRTATGSSQDGPVWIAPLGVIPADWRPHAVSLSFNGEQLLKWVRSVRRVVMDCDSMKSKVQQTYVKELGDAAERIAGIVRLWHLWGQKDEPGSPPVARWLTLAKGDASVVFHACAVSSADFLSSHLFSKAAGVLVTSATLSAGGDFSALARDLGLPGTAEMIALPSPFNLRRQGTIRVPSVRALPNDRDAHASECAQWLQKHLDWNAGNLVLFTARTRMEAAFNALPASRRGVIRMQNTAPKAQLIAEHCAAIERGEGSTLFGLASFGEGLDLKGRFCTRVVITSLPFQVPTDPVAQTFSAWIEQRGGNSFAEVSVPEATRVLTQYCGRLIRHEDDTGEIVILDRRIADKGYGRRMLKSLPPFRQVIESS